MTEISERVRKYGINVSDYYALDHFGGGVCWICKQPERIDGRSLAIDHDHLTGQVRGLLCTRCNQVLGRMHDNSDWLRNAADYIDEARRVFADDCSKCLRPLSHEQIRALDELPGQMTLPDGVVESRDGWTTFRYRCGQGHRWTCGWATKGLPRW